MERHTDHPLARGVPPRWATSWGEDRRGVWAAFSVEDVEHVLRYVAPATFWMGCDRRGLAGPRHVVRLTRGFWLGEGPCTGALCSALYDVEPDRRRPPDHPMISMSWDAVQTALEKLAGCCLGLRPRLPTEAEWAHAAQAGDEPVLVRLGAQPRVKSTRSTEEAVQNDFGFKALPGELLEWCADGVREFDREPVVDPKGSEGASGERAVRGKLEDGAWVRLALPSNVASAGITFRIACDTD